MDTMNTNAWIEICDLILKTVVVIGAAFWAIVLLVILKKREHALIDLRLKEGELRDIELKVNRQAVISVDIQPTIIRSPNDNGYVIIAVVILANKGNRNTRIKWRDEPPAFSVRLAKFCNNGQVDYGSPLDFRVKLTWDPRLESVSHVIRAGATESICFAGKVTEPGLYLLSFRGTVDEKERDEAKELGAQLPVAWTSNRYVFVGENPDQDSEATVV